MDAKSNIKREKSCLDIDFMPNHGLLDLNPQPFVLPVRAG